MHLFIVYSFIFLNSAVAELYILPNVLSNATVTPEFTSNSYGLDGPKVLPLNGTSFDWWYFDVVSTSTPNVSIVIQFTEASTTALALAGGNPAFSVTLSASFENGTAFSLPIASAPESSVVIS